MREMVETEEGKNGTNWSYELPQDFHEKLLKGIVWLRLKVEKLEGKFKLSQNRDLADYEGVLAGLSNEKLLKQMVDTRALYLRCLSLEDESLVQELMLSRPDYQQKVMGHAFTGKEAHEALTARPPHIDDKKKCCFGVFQNRELVAFVDLLRGYPDDKTVYLGLLMIHGKARSKGLGKQVYARIEALVREWTEIEGLRLGVATTNDVNGFWEKMGFKAFGDPRPCNVEGVTVVEMKKVL
jgi:GNAT superfamily N-acetyltransferase